MDRSSGHSGTKRMAACAAMLLLISWAAGSGSATAADPAPKPDGGGAVAAVSAGEAAQLVASGRQAMQEANADPRRSVAAAVSFSRALTYYESAGDLDKVCDLEANIFWCKKRMNADDVTSFVAQKSGDAGVANALAKVEAVAAKEIPRSEAKNYFERAERYASEHPDEYEQIAVRYFEVAERFVGSDLSLQAQKLSLEAQQKQLKRIKSAKESERQTLFTRSTAASALTGQQAPIPDAAALRTAVTAVRKLYKDGFAKTRPAQKHRLALKLLAQVPATKDDPVTQYALLSETIDLASAASDWFTLLNACDAMAQYFTGIDAKAKKKEVFEKAHANSTAQAILKLLDLPGDAEANTQAGKYFCFEADCWEIGLPLLVQGSDAECKALAEMELLKPAGTAEQVELGDKWYAMARKAKQPAQTGMLARAVRWYGQAEPNLSGVTKERITQRSDEIYLQVPEAGVDYEHITVKQWDRLLAKPIDINAANLNNDIGLVLTKGLKVVIVPHPTETWTMHYDRYRWNGGLANVFDTDATGLIPKERTHRTMVGGTPNIIGVMLVTVAGGMPARPGVLEGEGKVTVGPNIPGRAAATGSGRIRIKVVVLEED